MATMTEVAPLALELPESQRGILAVDLIRSLPPVLQDEDEGVAEVMLRGSEFDANPDIGISLDELDQRVRARRG